MPKHATTKAGDLWLKELAKYEEGLAETTFVYTVSEQYPVVIISWVHY